MPRPACACSWPANRKTVSPPLPRSAGAAAKAVEVGADRAARLIRGGLERGAEEIAVPGLLAVVGRALPLLPTFLRDWARRAFLPTTDAVVAEPDEAPLRSETGAGN